MKLYQDKEWLQKQVTEIRNKELIGRMCGCLGDTINYWMKKLGIPNIDYSTVGSATRLHHCNKQETVTAILHLLYDNATVYLERKFQKAQEVFKNIGSLAE